MKKALKEVGMDVKDIKTITNFYWWQTKAIRTENRLSDYIEIRTGMRGFERRRRNRSRWRDNKLYSLCRQKYFVSNNINGS